MHVTKRDIFIPFSAHPLPFSSGCTFCLTPNSNLQPSMFNLQPNPFTWPALDRVGLRRGTHTSTGKQSARRSRPARWNARSNISGCSLRYPPGLSLQLPPLSIVHLSSRPSLRRRYLPRTSGSDPALVVPLLSAAILRTGRLKTYHYR